MELSAKLQKLEANILQSEADNVGLAQSLQVGRWASLDLRL